MPRVASGATRGIVRLTPQPLINGRVSLNQSAGQDHVVKRFPAQHEARS